MFYFGFFRLQRQIIRFFKDRQRYFLCPIISGEAIEETQEEHMKLIHLSDLHLGKRVNEFSMLEDQKYILDEIVKIIGEEQADGVLVAGDVYDKPVPSTEAVQLFDRFLNRLANRNLYTFVISGNHDSAERLSFGNELMKERRVYVSPVFQKVPEPVVLQDEFGELCVYMLPFVKPVHVRHVFGEQEEKGKITSYNEAVKAVVQEMCVDEKKRNVILSHQFVTGAVRSESEEISVGGIDNVDASCFAGFDYVALGHIHGPQHISREEVRYSGTPLKYSFSESRHEKSVTVVELREKGDMAIRTIPLVPLRDMREIKGAYEELVSRKFYEEMNREDYLHITLTDEEDIPDALNKLRVIYPNIMKMDYDNTRTRSSRTIEETKDVCRKSPMELFGELYKMQNNQSLSEEQETFLKELIEKIWEDE